MQMVSFLWGGDVTSHILIMLDRLAGVSNSLDPTLRPSADRHGDGSSTSDDAQWLGCCLRVLSNDESSENA